MSEQGQAEMDELLDITLRHGEELLRKYGEFYPFGASIGTDGRLTMNAENPDLTEHPESGAVLDGLWKGLIGQRGALRAVAVVSDIRLKGSEGDAIRIEIEHREGMSITVLRPYRRRRLGRAYTFDELIAQPGEKRIWT